MNFGFRKSKKQPNDQRHSKDDLTDLIGHISQLSLQTTQQVQRVERELNQLRQHTENLEVALTSLQDHCDIRNRFQEATTTGTRDRFETKTDRKYKALIPKQRVKYNKHYLLQGIQEVPSKGDLVVILNKYSSTTDRLPQQGIIGVVQWIDTYDIGVTVTEGTTYLKKWKSCGRIDPREVTYEKQYPISSEEWESLMI